MFFYIGHTINAPEVTSAWGGTSQAEKPEQKGHSSPLPLPAPGCTPRLPHPAPGSPPPPRAGLQRRGCEKGGRGISPWAETEPTNATLGVAMGA